MLFTASLHSFDENKNITSCSKENIAMSNVEHNNVLAIIIITGENLYQKRSLLNCDNKLYYSETSTTTDTIHNARTRPNLATINNNTPAPLPLSHLKKSQVHFILSLLLP